jgi:hypothetical protein
MTGWSFGGTRKQNVESFLVKTSGNEQRMLDQWLVTTNQGAQRVFVSHLRVFSSNAKTSPDLGNSLRSIRECAKRFNFFQT